MYKISLLLIFVLYVQVSFGQKITLPQQFFYVSPSGSDANNPGTIDKPVATFEGAQKLVHNFKTENANVSVTVYFRGGKYYRAQSAIFTSEDSGTEAGPVKYMAFPGEVPLVLGGKQLQLNWKKHKDGIFKAEVSKGLIFESLFVNDEEQVLARYPNYDAEVRIFNGTAEDCISEEKVKDWVNPADGYFHVIHKALWGDFHYKITGTNENGELQMEGGFQNNRPENGIHPKLRFVENIFEELDAEREWYLDRNESILYFKPAAGVDLQRANIEVAYLENFITLTGTETEPVKYLSFDGFHFNRTIRTFMKTKDKLLRSDWAIYRGGAVYFEGTENCSIENCGFSQIGGNAVFMNAYNRYSKVEGCHIHDIGASAICFVGDTSAVRNPKFIPYGPPVSDAELDRTRGPKNNKYPAYCVAANNLLHDFGRVEKQVAGVQISMAAFITVSHNSIYDCPRSGINISEGAWGGHTIEFNDVFNTVLETSDHGSFNSWGRDRFWMVANAQTEARVEADRSLIFLDLLAPTIIRNNRMRCDHGWDIDLDDGSSYYYIYNNLCLNKGIKLREGYLRKVENNICINNAMHPHVWLKNNGDIIRGNIFGTRFFPIRVEHWGTEIDYNWFLSDEALAENQMLGLDKNSRAGDPLFANASKGDFRVLPESDVFMLGWKNFPMDEFGVQKVELKELAKTPEIPEVIVTKKDKQNTYDFYGGQIKNLETDGEVSATGMHDKTGVLVVVTPTFGKVPDFDLHKGDVILKVNNHEVRNVSFFLSEATNLFENGTKVNSITVWRNQGEVILK
ncbi:right-handed parallel beta-helix repeat-containing protein [Prolixibacteraceae bacterium Z1-6]|uniref:Right-handed parallel beta-helix repeat-containing protein n=1 Tax=Draconibacterium aestuarii TaxID=2998507 RepID=A0A9X3F890_9BACT|nr:right-handed parallel beta-helix repeat-containing protein [Prolixibacteraceae bacterium Z1-6]